MGHEQVAPVAVCSDDTAVKKNLIWDSFKRFWTHDFENHQTASAKASDFQEPYKYALLFLTVSYKGCRGKDLPFSCSKHFL